jgi:gamma-glutamyltranspeptidase/glutathione hydrolase
LSPQHGQEQAARINLHHAATNVQPIPPQGDTVWFGVVDKDGNAVSAIQSVYWDFGSGIVAGGTGVLLQNRGSYFSLDPNNVDRLEPGKRPFHTLNPAMLFQNKLPYLIYGTMGGEGQPQTQAAIVTRIVDFRMSPQDAIDAPRWLYGRTWGAPSQTLKLEGRISPQVIAELKQRGEPVQVVANYTDTMGHAGAILIHRPSGVLYGASDPRSDGIALGY